jgi:hypothetical protein
MQGVNNIRINIRLFEAHRQCWVWKYFERNLHSVFESTGKCEGSCQSSEYVSRFRAVTSAMQHWLYVLYYSAPFARPGSEVARCLSRWCNPLCCTCCELLAVTTARQMTHRNARRFVRLQWSGAWRTVAWYIDTSVSEGLGASVFGVLQYGREHCLLANKLYSVFREGCWGA